MTNSPVPPIAPETVPDWVYAEENIISNSPLMLGEFVRNIVMVLFQPDATQAERQAAVDLIGGEVVGGSRMFITDGVYFVRIASHGAGAALFRAVVQLEALPQVFCANIELVNITGPA